MQMINASFILPDVDHPAAERPVASVWSESQARLNNLALAAAIGTRPARRFGKIPKSAVAVALCGRRGIR
jgi:hypothetical protein